MAPDSERRIETGSQARERAVEVVRRAGELTRFKSFEWVPETGSTNDDLARRAVAGAPEQVLLTDLQTAGRGRRDRAWTAPAESAVLISFLIRDQRETPPFWTIGAVALGAAEAASNHAGVEVTLKWPNDLMVGASKTAGVLAQGIGDSVIVGIGLNVDWSGGRPAGIPEHATALDRHGRPGGIDRAALAADIVTRADRWLRSDLDELRAGWRGRCTTIGGRVRVELDDGELVGTATSVADDGALVVAGSSGIRAVHVGDVVHLRPSP